MKANLLILVNENLLEAKRALEQATDENIVRLCREYILMLSQYRERLYTLRGAPEICLEQPSMIARELVEQTRKAIRASVEITTKERNETESLLKSFTSISGYDAAETFNRLEHNGFCNWELRAGGVCTINETDNNRLSIQEAVDLAGRLRRKAYIAHKIMF